MKNEIKQITIIGLGLIGGSLALALKKFNYRIIGISKKEETLRLAEQRNAIDKGYTELNPDIFNFSDLVFIATPLNCLIEQIAWIGKNVKSEMILTDVGSIKLDIYNFARKNLPKNITFIGGHPLAGTEKKGFTSSQPDLFKNCAWALTQVDKDEHTLQALSLMKDLIQKLGAKPIVTTPEKHDKAVALVSHLPLLVSIGLCSLVKNVKDLEIKNLAENLASSGFRDMTRIGGGNPELNFDLITSNLLKISSLLPLYSRELEKIIKFAQKDPVKLNENLVNITKWRESLYSSEGKNKLLKI